MSDDAYIRLTRHGVRCHGVPAGEHSLLFVDVEPNVPLTGLRHANWAMFRDVGVVLVRSATTPASPERHPVGASPQESPFGRMISSVHRAIELMVRGPISGSAASLHGWPQDELAEVLNRDRTKSRFGAIRQELGVFPVLESEDDIDDEYLDRARAIELTALLEWGRGVWRPKDYHYRLPSGEHAEAFVRLGDAFQEPRDAEVLASWLFPHAREGLGIVVDTGTLSPLVLALHGAMRGQGLEPGVVEVLDSYPVTGHRVRHGIREAAKRNSVLAILSVNSSGRILDHMVEAMGSLGDSADRFIDVLVSKQRNDEPHSEQAHISIDIWHPLPDEPPMISYGDPNTDTCRWCADPQRSRVVPISPTSFDGTFEAAIRRLMPSIDDATENRALWEICDAGEGVSIQLEAEADEEVRGQRPVGRMPIKFDLGELVQSPEFRQKATAALKDRLEGRGVSLDANLVLVAEREFALEGFNQMLDSLRGVLGREAEVIPYPAEGEWSPNLKDAISKAGSICILALGAVTGTSLSTALVAAQQARQRGTPISAIVVHARLNQQRAWQTLENEFSGRLYPGFHSYISDRSPLQEELTLLNTPPSSIEARLTGDIEEFRQRRVAYCQDPRMNAEEGIFWGCSPEERLSPNSLYGERLRAKVVYAAVGSSMERARQQERGRAAPEQRVFDMPAIARSYYDPLILCAIFRWLQPHEQWWGTLPATGATSIIEMTERFRDPAPLKFLVPELLLASALGKVAPGPMSAVQAHARRLLEGDTLADRERAALELGLLLVPEHVSHDEKRARKRGGA